MAAVLGAGLTGCGGNASADDVVTVMTWAPMEGQAGAEPGVPAMAQAIADSVNANGGIQGHQLRVLACDEHNTAQGALACADQAAADHVAAVIGSSSQFAAQFMPTLENAGISYIGGSGASTAEFTSPYSYPVNGGYQTLLVGNGEQLAAAGCRRVAIVRPNTAVGDTMFDYLNDGLSSAHLTAVDVPVNPGQTSYGNEVETAIGSDQDGDCVTSALDAASTQTFYANWLQANPAHARLSALIGSFQQSLVDNLGGATGPLEGALATGWYPPDGSPVWKQLHAVIQKYAFTDNSINSADPAIETTWISYEVFDKVAATINGPITTQSVHAAFDATGPVSTDGATPPLSWQSTNLIALQSAPRTVNTDVSFQQVVNGELTEAHSGLVNVATQLTR
ncbi:ABC transporter substrate-binding protein [Streptacidiphilus fuscans]|uniref:ABC transporter substrate-binding protein n=1 Tax=Streptacidiphilus fuscans TaxID=2789292 RepID=A0A931B8M5_9ACTN|nr:ABC transporter substrate-binding protein [Streptacidiphilus fuscans]MBF9072146.1 ABC transporter substrate-binding protein [Streptacidiphilus fuscans]MBF9072957.1 ABC transporter substrate-binding protein [Streptacidiphilus fuscans]